MSQYTIYKAASDLAATNLTATPVDFAQAQITAFKAGNYDPADFNLFVTQSNQIRNQFQQLEKRLTPSEQAAATAAAAAARQAATTVAEAKTT